MGHHRCHYVLVKPKYEPIYIKFMKKIPKTVASAWGVVIIVVAAGLWRWKFRRKQQRLTRRAKAATRTSHASPQSGQIDQRNIKE
jgi:multidrug resistance efflux pump